MNGNTNFCGPTTTAGTTQLDQSGLLECQQGLLNGQIPGTAHQAQLLNATCQVAYTSGS